MRSRIAVPVASAVAAVTAAAVLVAALRSQVVPEHATTASAAVSLARVVPDGPVVTVPALNAGETALKTEAAVTIASSMSLAHPRSAATSSAPASDVPAGSRLAGGVDTSAGSASSLAVANSASASIAAARAAASIAAASIATASAAAASSRTSEAASRSRASSVAAFSSQASSSSASLAAASSSQASSAAASEAASRLAANAYAAAHPAPDTSEAVSEAVEQAAESGITQSVVVMNKQTGSVTTAVNADIEMPSMSLVKLILAADVIDTAGGAENVDLDTLDELHQMIIASDDSIAQALYDRNGKGAIITRMAIKYGLLGTSPSPQPRYWGDVRITARDMASLLDQLLHSVQTGDWFTEAMQGALSTGADGFDQDFGMNSVPGAGSKQGWGCCLGRVLSVHSVGFTASQIIVVLSTAEYDMPYQRLNTSAQLTRDPGARASVGSVSTTVRAALPPT
jgi:hypothetical protein